MCVYQPLFLTITQTQVIASTNGVLICPNQNENFGIETIDMFTYKLEAQNKNGKNTVLAIDKNNPIPNS